LGKVPYSTAIERHIDKETDKNRSRGRQARSMSIKDTAGSVAYFRN